MNITKIEKYKKLNIMEHKKDMNITKIEKYKKLNSNPMTEDETEISITKQKKLIMTQHKTDMNITKIKKYITKHEGAENRPEHY